MARNKYDRHIKFAPQYHAEVQEKEYKYQPSDPYHERPVSRKEIRERYDQLYKLEQERDQRAYDRVMDAQNRFYAGIDPRRRKEVADAGMVSEDHHAIANLSPQFIHREFPKSRYYATPYIDDDVRSLFNNNGPFEEK